MYSLDQTPLGYIFHFHVHSPNLLNQWLKVLFTAFDREDVFRMLVFYGLFNITTVRAIDRRPQRYVSTGRLRENSTYEHTGFSGGLLWHSHLASTDDNE